MKLYLYSAYKSNLVDLGIRDRVSNITRFYLQDFEML